MITTANFQSYRKGDFYQFMVNVLELVTAERATTLSVSAQRTALATEVQLFADAYTPIVGSDITPQLAELDTRRDEALLGLKTVLEGFVKHFEADKRNAAFILLDLMKGYGENIYRLRYQLETATVSNLLSDWKTQHADKLTLLGITDWVTHLEDANTQFNQLYVSRTQQISGLQTGVLDTLRANTTDAYRALKAHIEAHGLLTPTELNAQVQQEISSLAIQYNDAVTRYTSTEEENDTPAPPTPENNE